MKKLLCLLFSLLFTLSVCGCAKLGDNIPKLENDIDFQEPLFEKYVRVAVGKLDGDILQSDLDTIKKLYVGFGMEYSTSDYEFCLNEDKTESNIGDMFGELPRLTRDPGDEYANDQDIDEPLTYEDLKYFKNMQALSIFSQNLRTAEFLKELKNLQYLDIDLGQYPLDLNHIKSEKLVSLEVGGDAVTGYDALLKIDSLKFVKMNLPEDIENKLLAKGVIVVSK